METKLHIEEWVLSLIHIFMPAPTDIPAITGVDEDGNEVVRHSSDEEPFSALAFKIMADPFVGKLASVSYTHLSISDMTVPPEKPELIQKAQDTVDLITKNYKLSLIHI